MTVSHLRFGPRPIQSTVPDLRGGFRRVPPIRASRSRRRARAGAAWSDLPAEQSRTAPTRSGTTCRVTCRRPSSTSSIDFHVIDATRVAARCRHGPPDQHDHADLLLRAEWRAAARGGDRGHQAVDPEELRQAWRRRRHSRTSRPWTRRWHTCTNAQSPDQITTADEPPPLVPRTAAGLRAARHRAHHGRRGRSAACQRVPGRWVVPDQARRSGRSAISPWRFRYGTSSCASSAANACSCARMPPYAPRSMARRIWTTRPSEFKSATAAVEVAVASSLHAAGGA